MIAIISGLPGSGKTLAALKRFIIPAVRQGREIYTNIEGIDLLGISLYTGSAFEETEKKLIAYEKEADADGVKEPFKFSTKRMKEAIKVNSLVVIDEAQTIWNNRDYASEENKSFLPFLQKHRHYGIDIVFLTQNIDQLDIGIRRLTQVHYRLKRLSNAGLDKLVKVDIYPDAMGSEQFKPMTTNVWTIDKEIFKFYTSYLPTASEAKKPVGNLIIKNPRLIAAVLIIAVCVFLAYRQLKSDDKMFAPKMLQQDYSGFSLGDYEEYFCGDRFYVLRSGGKVDTLPPKSVPPSYCPSFNHHHVRNGK
jgi:zona occludens toxin (predicted ATPase)